MNWLTRRRLWALAIVALMIGMVEFLPAHLFEDRINRELQPPWRLSVSGTVWDGFGVAQAGQTVDAPAIPFTWKFDPASLFRGRLAWKITPDSPQLSGSIKVGAGWQSLEFRDAALTMDAAMLQHVVPLLAVFAPWGSVALNTPPEGSVTVDLGTPLRVNGEARLQADNLGLRPYGPQTLGSYPLKLTARDTMIDYTIGPSSGALKIDGGGSIQLDSPRQIAYSGFVTASPTLNETLLAQVRAMGQPAADGRIRVDWKSRW